MPRHQLERSREHNATILLNERIDSVCDRFERSLTSEPPPQIEDYLIDWDEPGRSRLLYELLLLELDARCESGPAPERDEYLARFPNDFSTVNSVFEQLNAESRANESTVVTAGPMCDSTDGVDGEKTAELIWTPSSVPGRQFGDYELLEEIARGGMGVVYKARQKSLNRVVALKMILSGQLAAPEDVRRFYGEAEAAAKLNHPGIVPIFEIGERDGQHFFSMEYIHGKSLANLIREGPLPPREAAARVTKIASAVAYAHEQGIIHRDLKPTNVLLDEAGEPHVTDFGLARNLASDSGLTATGQILGTPSYMPPEQASGDTSRVSPVSDVYSLGALLYCLITGRPPFQAASVMETLKQVQEQEPVTPRALNPDVDIDLETICLKCLQKDAGRRYQTGADLATDLCHWLAGEPITARPVSAIERSWRWCRRNPALTGMWVVTTLLLLTLGIGGSLFAVQQSNIATEQTELRGEAEAAAETAHTQTRLALDTLNTVIFDIQHGLKNVPGAGAVRRKLLNSALERLQQIAREFAESGTADRQTAVALTELADVFLRVSEDEDRADDASSSGPLKAARDLYERANEIIKSLAAADPNNTQVQRILSISYDNLGHVSLRTGQVTEARDFYQQSLDIKKKLAVDLSNRLAQHDLSVSYENLGDVSLLAGQLQKAIGFHMEALDIAKMMVAANPSDTLAQRDLSISYERLGDISLQAGQVPEAHNFYRQYQEIAKTLAAADPNNAKAQRDLSRSYDRLGDVSRRTGQVEEALDFYSQSLDIARTLVSADSTDVQAKRYLSIALIKLGDVSRQSGQLRETLDYYEQSLAILKKKAAADRTDAQSQRDLSVLYHNLGDVSLQTSQVQQAHDFYQQSHDIRKALAAVDPTDNRAQRDLGISYTKLGDVSLRKGQPQNALGYYRQSHTVLKMAAEADRTDSAAQRDLGVSFEKLGDVSLQTNQVQEAHDFYQQSHDIGKALAAVDPTDTQAQLYLGISYTKLGYVYLQTGKLPEALEFYQQSLVIRKTLAVANPTDALIQRDLSLSYEKLGDVSLQRSQLTEARDFYQQSLDIARTLAAADPTNAQSQRNLSVSYNKLGDVSLRKGQLTEALDYYQKNFDIDQTLAAADPTDVQAQRDLSASYQRLGDVSLQSGQAKEAFVFYQQHLGIARTLAAADPTNAQAQRNLSVSYNKLGDVKRRMGQVTEALGFYQKSLDIRKTLAADSTNAFAQRDLWFSYYKLGRTQRELFAYTKAVERYRAGVDVLDRMIESGQDVEAARSARMMLEQNIQSTERALVATGDWETVLEHVTKTPNLLYYRAAELAKQQKFDSAAQAAANFREIAQTATEQADLLYNAACAYGLCAAAVQPTEGETLTNAEQSRRKGYLNQSLTCLKEAIVAGYKDFEDARQDPDLAVLRELSEFQEVIDTTSASRWMGRPAPPPLPEPRVSKSRPSQ